MKFLFFILLFSLFAITALPQDGNSAAAIKQKMALIRKSTNWESPTEAKKANEQIRELSKQLMMTGPGPQNLPKNLSEEEAEQAKVDATEDKMEMWGQIMESAAKGPNADILLAKPARERIKEEYRQDEIPPSSCPMFQQEMTLLYLDMSQPAVKLIIEQMEKFKSVKTLVITGGKNGAPVNLTEIMAKAVNYPLELLYIINFKGFVTSVPVSIARFQNLTHLALFNNKISSLPPEISKLVSLKNLYVDINPIASLPSTISSLTSLDTLSIAKTGIIGNELLQIKKYLPDCKILSE